MTIGKQKHISHGLPLQHHGTNFSQIIATLLFTILQLAIVRRTIHLYILQVGQSIQEYR